MQKKESAKGNISSGVTFFVEVSMKDNTMLCRGSCNLDRCLDVGIAAGLVTEATKAAGTNPF